MSDYLDFLADKYQVKKEQNIIALGGIWGHTPLNVSDNEVRKL
jgi:hypothetical protein